MKRKQSRSIRDRKESMSTFAESTQQDLDGGNPILTAAIIAVALTLNSEYQTAYNNLTKTNGIWRNAVSKHAEQVDELSHANNDFYVTLKRRSRRLKHPPGVLGFYKGPGDSGRPQTTTQKQVVHQAKDILEGERQALDQEFPAMTNPSVEDIQGFLTETTKAAQALTLADRDYQEKQQVIQALAVKVDLMLGDLNRAFLTATHDLSDSARRRLMRRYGFSFEQGSKENPELEDEFEDEIEEPSTPQSQETQPQPGGESETAAAEPN